MYIYLFMLNRVDENNVHILVRVYLNKFKMYLFKNVPTDAWF